MLPFQMLKAESIKTISVMSFGEWKQHTKKDIQDRMISLQSKISDQKTIGKNFNSADHNVAAVETNKQKTDQLSSQLRNEKMRLEASNDLTFHEYFVSYLLLQKDFDH